MRHTFPLICALFLLAATGAAQHLPDTANPEHYQITLAPDFRKENFVGDETLQIRVLKPTPSITLNALEITFQDALIAQNGVKQAAKVTTDVDKQQATLTVPKLLAAGTATIHIRYAGILNGDLRGFYLSKTEKRKYATTQFENTDARRAFPSFDEPAFKATFEVSAVIDQGDIALSNMKVASDTPGPGSGKHTVKFDRTPKMSSYLVALAVGDFECEEGAADGIPVRVCGTPDKKGMGQFALQAAEYSLHFYNRYFGIKYPYGKLDLLGMPDFAAGAMENTGLIIGRDFFVFADPRTSSYSTLKIVAQEGVGHEMAHQWFGDLVTMKWWDDVWLNEGFATWMAFKPIEAWKPGWNVDADLVQSNTGAMDADSLMSTHPIHQTAETPAQITELFDDISYSKTAAVLTMIEGYVGTDVFRKGVNSYLSKYAYGNATAEDFWSEIARASKKPVDKIMAGFVMQPGVPQVSMAASCFDRKSKVELRQSRYFWNRDMFNAGSKEMWQIPVCLKAGGAEKCELLSTKSQTVELPGCGPIYANAGARGYYRSGYDAENLRKLAQTAEQSLSPLERTLLIQDAWSQMRVDKIKIGDFLALADALKNDPTRAVMDNLAGDLVKIETDVVGDNHRSQYHHWVREMFVPVGEKLGWTPAANDSEEQRALRADLLRLVGGVGHDPKLIQFSRELVQKVLSGHNVDSTLLGEAMVIAARNGDAALYEEFMKRVQNPKSPEDYLRFFKTLGYFQQPELIQRTLQYAVSPQVRTQDALFVFGSLMSDPGGRKPAWDFIRQHWTEVKAKMPEADIGFFVEGARSFCDNESRDQVQQFFTEHPIPAAQRALQRTLETISNCVDTRTQQQASLAAWLEKQPTGAKGKEQQSVVPGAAAGSR